MLHIVDWRAFKGDEPKRRLFLSENGARAFIESLRLAKSTLGIIEDQDGFYATIQGVEASP